MHPSIGQPRKGRQLGKGAAREPCPRPVGSVGGQIRADQIATPFALPSPLGRARPLPIARGSATATRRVASRRRLRESWRVSRGRGRACCRQRPAPAHHLTGGFGGLRRRACRRSGSLYDGDGRADGTTFREVSIGDWIIEPNLVREQSCRELLAMSPRPSKQDLVTATYPSDPPNACWRNRTAASTTG